MLYLYRSGIFEFSDYSCLWYKWQCVGSSLNLTVSGFSLWYIYHTVEMQNFGDTRNSSLVPRPPAAEWSLGMRPRPLAAEWSLGTRLRPPAAEWSLGTRPRPLATEWSLGTRLRPPAAEWSLGTRPRPPATEWSLGTRLLSH